VEDLSRERLCIRCSKRWWSATRHNAASVRRDL
jgi:hypothetical protein